MNVLCVGFYLSFVHIESILVISKLEIFTIPLIEFININEVDRGHINSCVERTYGKALIRSIKQLYTFFQLRNKQEALNIVEIFSSTIKNAHQQTSQFRLGVTFMVPLVRVAIHSIRLWLRL